ncbi:MAG: hypothetical protein NE328_23270 [Lentisphaeraceae bacterium]|nr:hypothetical protein [Lentisphaeraceae bacterium]
MLTLKYIAAVLLLLSGLKLSRAEKHFKWVLISYVIISVICFYFFFRDAFIAFYSGVEIRVEDGTTELRFSESYFFILIVVAVINLLPLLLFINKIKKIKILLILLLVLPILPDVFQEQIWDVILVEEIERRKTR